MSSQPRRSVTSGVPAGAHSVPSRCQMRWTTSSSAARLIVAATACSSSAGRSASIAAGRPVTIASRLDSIPSSSLSIGTTNASMPSRSSLSVTSSRSIPASRSASRSARRVVGGRRAGDVAVARGGGERRQRHRVHGVRPDEAVDVHRLRVGGVLDAGRRPQRALHRAPASRSAANRSPSNTSLEREVGGAGVGEPGAAREIAAAERLEPLVDLGVDARDEERRDRVAVERLALGVAALHRAEERLHHALVVGDREQQRDVDVHALVQRLLDRRDPLVGGGDLDHQVRAVDEVPVHAGLLERALGVVREARRDLERDVAVVAAVSS